MKLIDLFVGDAKTLFGRIIIAVNFLGELSHAIFQHSGRQPTGMKRLLKATILLNKPTDVIFTAKIRKNILEALGIDDALGDQLFVTRSESCCE